MKAALIWTTHVGVNLKTGDPMLWHGTLPAHLKDYVNGEEGKTWIRGHYTEKDEQGAALLAAYALTRGAA